MSREEGTETVDPELLELEAELRKAQDELQVAEEARTKKSRVVDMRESIETARRKKAEEEILAKTIEELGPLGKAFDRVDIQGSGMFLIRRPDPIKVKRLFEKAQDKDHTQTLDETYEMSRNYLIYPPRERVDQMYAESPLIAQPLSNAVLKLAGLRLQKVSGK